MFEKLTSILNKRSSARQAQYDEHSLLIGLRNRLLALFQWACSYLTFTRDARLIYGTFRPKKEPVTATNESLDPIHRGATGSDVFQPPIQ